MSADPRNSPNYRAGEFRNLTPTEITLRGASTIGLALSFVATRFSSRPQQQIPVVATDLGNLPDLCAPGVVWFGHSSYLLRYQRRTVLVDPTFSPNASPVPLVTREFAVSHRFTAEDMPEIDLVLVTHDHFDHLDRPTIEKLKERTKAFIVPLGVGRHLRNWSVDARAIVELDWHQTADPFTGLRVTATPARHNSGRATSANQSLWCSFVLKWGAFRLFVGGDSGYDDTFRRVGAEHGPFDLAFLECGQYHAAWPCVHMFPEQVAQAAVDLRAQALLPVHWAKFSTAMHEWNEPVKRLIAAAGKLNQRVVVPQIGELYVVAEPLRSSSWWC